MSINISSTQSNRNGCITVHAFACLLVIFAHKFSDYTIRSYVMIICFDLNNVRDDRKLITVCNDGKKE